MRRAPVQTCAAHRCSETVQRGMLMCRDHWFSLPRQLRSAIGHTWRARQMQAYAQNVQAALELISEREHPFQEAFSETRFLGKAGSDRAQSLPNLIKPEFGGVAR